MQHIKRIEKESRHIVGDSHPVIIKEFETEEEESQYISETIIALGERHYNFIWSNYILFLEA